MKKKVFGRNLGRSYTAKKALYRSLVRAIVFNGEITTTKAKAKAFLPEIEKMINIAKKGGISERRRIYATLANSREEVDKVFEIAKVFKDRTGGYFRVVNLPPRKGDNAKTVKVCLTQKLPVSEKNPVSPKGHVPSGDVASKQVKSDKQETVQDKSVKGKILKKVAKKFVKETKKKL
jgi:large subunit ribosomal protein L17